MSKEDYSIHLLRKVVIDGFLLCGLILSLTAIHILWLPFERGFFCGDQTLMFPYKDDTVTVTTMRVVGIGLPLLAIVICEWALLRNEKTQVRCLGVPIPPWIQGVYCSGIAFALGLCFSELCAQIAKNTIGRPRPHFFDICQPSIDCSAPQWQNRYIVSSEYECNGSRTDKFRDMRMSFLSGHSSWSAYCMLFFVLYLQKRMVWSGTRVLRHVMQFTALMLSWFTALSRVSDFKHHWSDVLAGYVMGSIVALVTWNYCTDLVEKKKNHAPLPQHEVNLNTTQVVH